MKTKTMTPREKILSDGLKEMASKYDKNMVYEVGPGGDNAGVEAANSCAEKAIEILKQADQLGPSEEDNGKIKLMKKRLDYGTTFSPAMSVWAYNELKKYMGME